MIKRTSFLILMVAMTLAFSVDQALARTDVIYSSGYSTGFCDGNSSYFCIQDMKDKAKSDARREADFQCWARQGRLDNNPFPYCMEFCNPPYLSPDSSMTYVSCRLDCQYDCVIPDAHPPAENDSNE